VFPGGASLFQGDATTRRGTPIRIDQEQGNLNVTGAARFVQAGNTPADRVDGRAEEIRYTDNQRLVEYLSARDGSTPRVSGTVRVTGPEGDLEAGKVEMFLPEGGGRADRLEAYRNVTARIDTKRATADRLTYTAATDQYDMKGAGAVPVKIVYECGVMTSKSLTYYKADDRIVALANDEQRTETRNAACQPTSPSSR